jgi:hypothetical protein
LIHQSLDLNHWSAAASRKLKEPAEEEPAVGLHAPCARTVRQIGVAGGRQRMAPRETRLPTTSPLRKLLYLKANRRSAGEDRHETGREQSGSRAGPG